MQRDRLRETGPRGPDGPDHATSGDGSDSPYRAASVSEVIVTLGGENRGADGVVLLISSGRLINVCRITVLAPGPAPPAATVIGPARPVATAMAGQDGAATCVGVRWVLDLADDVACVRALTARPTISISGRHSEAPSSPLEHPPGRSSLMSYRAASTWVGTSPRTTPCRRNPRTTVTIRLIRPGPRTCADPGPAAGASGSLGVDHVLGGDLREPPQPGQFLLGDHIPGRHQTPNR